MDAFKALELIEELELSLAEMYGRLRHLYSGDKMMSGLFTQLEIEEQNHAGMAAVQKWTARARPEEYGDLDFNFNDVRPVVDRIAVVRAMPKNKLAEILVQCYVIESTLVEQYVVVALREPNKDISELFDTLSNGFRDHLTALAAWIKETGADAANPEALRRHPRVSFSVTATINGQVSAQSVDVSESGIFLRTSNVFREGELITLKFPILDGKVSMSARVRYSVPNAGVGVAFSGISDGDRQLIRRYVNDCLQKQADEIRKKQASTQGTPPVR